jgi:hypothetical protein
MSRIGFLNKNVFQWLGFRIYKYVDFSKNKILTTVLLFPIFPGSGWNSDFYPKNHFSVKLWSRQ